MLKLAAIFVGVSFLLYTDAFQPLFSANRFGCKLRPANTCHHRAVRGRNVVKCSKELELDVGVSDDVQNVGRGTLLSQKDAVKEVSVKVKGLYDAYPYPPEAVFDGPTVGYNHRYMRTACRPELLETEEHIARCDCFDPAGGHGHTLTHSAPGMHRPETI
jgi:hypothetical protein